MLRFGPPQWLLHIIIFSHSPRLKWNGTLSHRHTTAIQPGGVDEQRKEENDLGNENMNFISRRVFVVIIVGTSQQVQERKVEFFLQQTFD